MPVFDLSLLGEYALLLLIPGIVETAKKFGLAGNASLGLSLVLGAFFVGLAQAIAQGLVPAAALPWLNVVLVGVGGALAASGYYDLFKKFTGNGG
jgi:hypothetical protein